MALGQTLAIPAPAFISGVTANQWWQPPGGPSSPVTGTNPHCLRLKPLTGKDKRHNGRHPPPESSGFFSGQPYSEGPGCPLVSSVIRKLASMDRLAALCWVLTPQSSLSSQHLVGTL